MALNPIVYTDKIVRSFLRYQLTAYPFADSNLHQQMRQLLSMDEVRDTPLFKGPYISLSRSFKEGASIQDLIKQGILHPHMARIIPDNIKYVYGHQETALRAIHSRKTTLISTGTGSGKTECFLYPIISKCLELKDQQAPAGISAVIVYPMNALAQDQLDRLRGLLAGSGITFGMYIGKTPEYEREVTGYRLKSGSSKADYLEVLAKYRKDGRPDAVHPFEEVCSREKMRTPGSQPRILLTNVKQLELLLTRHQDVELFDNARLDYLIFDEAHTFNGIQGAETACLIRRLRTFCGKASQDTVCVATSATIVDIHDPDAAKKFAYRFFGVPVEQIQTVNEEYKADVWGQNRTTPPQPNINITELLNRTLKAVDADKPEQEIKDVYRLLTNKDLDGQNWQEALYDGLAGTEIAYQIRQALETPKLLTDLIEELKERIGRNVTAEELLIYLTLGAASLKNNRPLLRPVVHGFIRGISGAVVTFPADSGNQARLWLSSEDEIAASGEENIWRPQVFTCTTCGQHYYITFLKDFEFTKAAPEGGQLAEDGHFWEAVDKDHGGKRVILLDRLICQEEDEETEDTKNLHPVYFCRYCGAAHPQPFSRCQGCGSVSDPVKLFAVRQKQNSRGNLSSCVSCRSRGKSIGRHYREPIRQVRAVNVSDVHVLAQDMVHHAECKRLLLFTDNRQDAAFQAGWMKDHARRFRLRRLMADVMKEGPVSVGDMVYKLDHQLDSDDNLSRALIPEVWRVVQKEAQGGQHSEERKHFLRIQVLREVTTASNQQIGLEPWGRLKVTYQGLDATSQFVRKWSRQIGLPPEDLHNGIANLLDQLRRNRLLWDSHREIFSRYWHEGDREIQRGYMPILPGPKGMKLTADAGDKKALVYHWLGSRPTLVKQIVQKWGVDDSHAVEFLTELWEFLIEQKILIPVTLKGNRGNPLPSCSGVYQIDSTKLLLSENHGYHRCKRCNRKVARRTPQSKCMAWYCDGELEFIAEDPDNYDLQLLDQGYSMLRPEEHTAMVPQEQRDRYENIFKSDSDALNTLVCTPTLELGVDIGSLDSVLLRNVPPLPSNYWQRVGRAGRRHRMAVNFTYCRQVSHDRAYYIDPIKMLAGRLDPPSFHLRNDVMVSKHVHASAITFLYQLTHESSGLPKERRKEILSLLKKIFPTRISTYLFENTGEIRTALYDLTALENLISEYKQQITDYIKLTFQQNWPQNDFEVVESVALLRHVEMMKSEFEGVLNRIRKRLLWAHNEINRLNQLRAKYGTLEQEDEAHFRRCDRLIKKMKGIQTRRRQEAEGVDDINTYNMLAAEGFLPGYGLESGSVVGMAEVPYWQLGSMDFDLPRPTSLALREYVPGNLIYANGHRFVARRFHREPGDDRSETPTYEVNIEREAIIETNLGGNTAGLGSATIRAISICDVDLMHQSQISDEEETRFQMPVSVYGRELDRHNGGVVYRWGDKSLIFRKGVHLRLVNVGSTPIIEQKQQLGYPVCVVCGQSVSPLSSDRQLQLFMLNHEEQCGKKPEMLGFFANIVADCLKLPECGNQTEAYSILEVIRMAATQVLDMHLGDLQLLVIGHVDRDTVDGLLWDPMPGGSGLIEQILSNFADIVRIAKDITRNCPSACEHSCIDCLQTFRNGYYHKYLDRHLALKWFDDRGDSLARENDIPPSQPTTPSRDLNSQPVNDAETKLKHLLKAAGFMDGEFQRQIKFKQPINVGHQIGSTTPDIFYAGDMDDEDDKGVCIYLDGLSDSVHGNPETAQRDREIRNWLRNNGYQVIEITVVELDDHRAMVRHFKKLAKLLSGKDMADKIAEDPSWFTC